MSASDILGARVVDYWTSERRATAIPRDLMIDPRGLAYLLTKNGSLRPYGHQTEALATVPTTSSRFPFGSPSGNVAQDLPVKGVESTGAATSVAGDTHSDRTAGAANQGVAPFAGVMPAWGGVSADGAAVGRLYFEMPSSIHHPDPWAGYVCLGTVVTDGAAGRSLIITAAHCIYDDVNKVFARNVLFMQGDIGANRTRAERNCFRDSVGCWVPALGIVDKKFTLGTFPSNVTVDYGFYVVNDSGTQWRGAGGRSDALDVAAGSIRVRFADPRHDLLEGSADATYAFGFSYSNNPRPKFCRDRLTTRGSGVWWLGQCDVGDAAAGGPWLQPSGHSNEGPPIIAISTWSYSHQSGWAGSRLSDTSATCLFQTARTAQFGGVIARDGDGGIAVACQ